MMAKRARSHYGVSRQPARPPGRRAERIPTSEADTVEQRAARYRRDARAIRARATAETDDRRRAELLEVSDACDRVADRLERTAARK
jgi:pyruvate-formate lyase